MVQVAAYPLRSKNHLMSGVGAEKRGGREPQLSPRARLGNCGDVPDVPEYILILVCLRVVQYVNFSKRTLSASRGVCVVMARSSRRIE
jgi:hypothetical protein